MTDGTSHHLLLLDHRADSYEYPNSLATPGTSDEPSAKIIADVDRSELRDSDRGILVA